MRLLALSLRNFRGTTARDIELAPGVTVVEGPNEAGKSSLAEALRLLLDHDIKSDSRKREVERIRPLGQDGVVPEVAAEIDAPPYRFVYRKRFSHRKKDRGGTELEVRTPRPERHAGEDAARRVAEILRETLDVDLFRALQIEQGRAVGQTRLGATGWLGDALDRASGGAGVDGDGHETLFERVNEESRKYHTEKTLAESRLLAAAREALCGATACVDELRAKLRSVEAAVEEHARLARLLRDQTERLPALVAEADLRNAEVARLEAVERRAQELEGRARHEDACVQALEGAHRQRQATIAQRDALAQRLATARRQLATATEHAAERRSAADASRAARTAARDAHSRAEAARTAAARASTRLAHQERAAALRRQRDEAARLAARIHDLQPEIGGAVADAELAELEQLAHQLAVKREALRSECARLSVEALTDLELDVGGRTVRITRGSRFEPDAGENVDLTLPGVLRVQLAAGAGARPLVEQVADLDRRLRQRLGQHGADHVDVVRARARAARRARTECDDLGGRLARLLDDVPGDAAAAPLERLDGAIARETLAAERLAGAVDADAPIPLIDAEIAEQQARAALRRADDQLDALVEQCAHADSRRAELDAEVRTLGAQIEETDRGLDAERSARSDETLAQELDEARRRAASLGADARALREQLAASDLPARRASAERAAQAVTRAHGDRHRTEAALHGQAAVLRHEEGLGLAEQLQEAEACHAHAEQELALVERRAAAARLLCETLRAHRDAARAAYVRPLAERIERLGSVVFGDSFRIEMRDDLTIGSRTLRGLPVPFEDLSVGAREQLDVILRLAAAMAVADRGGVPLVLDDTLGSADPERLAAMNALLAFAGERVQVIVLTCHPERFARIGDAAFVRLSAADQMASSDA